MKMGSALEIFSSLLAKFLEWPVDQNVVSQLRTWHFPPPSRSNGGWRNNHIKYQEKKSSEKTIFHAISPLQKSAFVCSLIEKSKLLRWRLVSQSRSLWLRFELFNIFPGPGWESRNYIFEGNKINFLNDNLFSFITRSALPLHAFFFKLPTLLFSVDMQIVERVRGPGTDWKYKYNV